MKVGLTQIGKTPPLWLSRLSDALVVILGAAAGYSMMVLDEFNNQYLKITSIG